jgi:hypothetical protein
VKTEKPSARITVNCEVCISAIAMSLPVLPSCVNKVSINPVQNSSYKSGKPLSHDNIIVDMELECSMTGRSPMAYIVHT